MTTFDRNLARLLLEICRYAYAESIQTAENKMDTEDALNWINQAGEPTAIVPLKDDKPLHTSAAYLFCYPDKNIVSYMGTVTEFRGPLNSVRSTKDWLDNFRALPVPFELDADQVGLGLGQRIRLEGKVHQGFLNQLSEVQAKVVAELLRRGGKERPLYVTGHSQGAAEAVLAARAFLAGGFSVAAVYTFAAPRAGDQEFVNSFPATLPFHRIEFGNDLVPHVPPTLMNKGTELIMKGLSYAPFIPGHVKELLKFITQNSGYVSAGSLCYGNNASKELHVDIPLQEEAGLLMKRLMQLIRHPEQWNDHHHLAGTTEEVEAGRKGNYTALVSEFPLVES